MWNCLTLTEKQHFKLSWTFYNLDREKWEKCCWTVVSVIPACSAETCPPAPAGHQRRSTVCSYTVSPAFNSTSAGFVFVGYELSLSGGKEECWEERWIFLLEGNRTWSHAPALQGRRLWVASQKGAQASIEEWSDVRKPRRRTKCTSVEWSTIYTKIKALEKFF